MERERKRGDREQEDFKFNERVTEKLLVMLFESSSSSSGGGREGDARRQLMYMYRLPDCMLGTQERVGCRAAVAEAVARVMGRERQTSCAKRESAAAARSWELQGSGS